MRWRERLPVWGFLRHLGGQQIFAAHHQGEHETNGGTKYFMAKLLE